MDSDVHRRLYISLVRSHLEYGYNIIFIFGTTIIMQEKCWDTSQYGGLFQLLNLLSLIKGGFTLLSTVKLTHKYKFLPADLAHVCLLLGIQIKYK